MTDKDLKPFEEVSLDELWQQLPVQGKIRGLSLQTYVTLVQASATHRLANATERIAAELEAVAWVDDKGVAHPRGRS
jgi:hypothetical protein